MKKKQRKVVKRRSNTKAANKERRRLANLRARAAARRYLLHGKKVKAVEEAGYSKETARTHASRVLAQPASQEYLAELIEREGISDAAIVRKYILLLDAQGKESADNHAQLTANDRLAQLKGLLRRDAGGLDEKVQAQLDRFLEIFESVAVEFIAKERMAGFLERLAEQMRGGRA